MSSLTKAEKKAQSLESTQQRKKAKEKAMKLQITEFMASGLIGFAEGYAENAGISVITEGVGPVKFEYIQAGLGIYLATKKTGKTREVGSAMANIGLYKLGKGLGQGFDLGGLLGGE